MRRTCVLLAATQLFLGCEYKLTPHENFVNGLIENTAGYDIRKFRDFENFVQTPLPNGNIEFRLTRRFFPAKNPCSLIYEVDAATYKIVRARYEGADSDCILPP